MNANSASTRLESLLSSSRQTARTLRLVFPNDDAPRNTLLVANRLNAREAMGRDFQFEVELLSDSPGVDAASLMGKMVTVELVRHDGTTRYFNGHIFEFRFVGNDGGLVTYRMVVKPWLAFLRYRRDNFLFHGLDVQQQTGRIFSEYPQSDCRTHFLANDAVMTDACQFDECDYNYLHRRWEALGWCYWYEHRLDGHTLVLSGDTTETDPMDGPGHLMWTGHSQQAVRGLRSFASVRTITPTSYASSSFDFKQPMPMVADNLSLYQHADAPSMEVYDYSGAYAFASTEAGGEQVNTRLQEIEAAASRYEATGDDEYVQCGRCFTLKGQEASAAAVDGNAEFLILEAHHVATNNHAVNDGGTAEYSCSFACVSKTIPWRPGQGLNSRQPKIHGLQTATVVGPAGEEIHTDEYGRVRIQFHWDREGGFDERSSAWVRVATSWAGSNFGLMSVPRIGQEVVVSWLDGNPDRPLVIGSVYNQSNMPPWDLPANKTQSGVLTRSSDQGGADNANAIRFEDKKGAEQLWIHAEKNQDIEVENDETHWVGNDRRKTVDRDETVKIGRDETINVERDRTETVDGNETITIHQNRTERVDQDETISIGQNRTEDVGANETVSISGSRTVSVGGAKSETVKKTKTETIGLAKALTIGGAFQTSVGAAMNTTVGLSGSEQVGVSKNVRVGKSYTINVGDEFKVVVGKSTLVMQSDGTVVINGTRFDFAASGVVQIAGKDVDIN